MCGPCTVQFIIESKIESVQNPVQSPVQSPGSDVSSIYVPKLASEPKLYLKKVSGGGGGGGGRGEGRARHRRV